MADQIRTSIVIEGKLISDTLISAVSIHQSLSGHHSFELHFKQDLESGGLAHITKSWIGKAITIGFDYEENKKYEQKKVTDRFKGFVTKVGLSRYSGEADLLISGYSPTYLMDDGNRNRSFTDKTLEEIIHEVADPYSNGFSTIEISPQISTASIPYLVQYREQNYAFINRLANRFGEWCFYDGLSFHFGYKPSKGKTIKLDFNEHGLQSFDLTVQVQSGQTNLGAYDYETNTYNVESSTGKAKADELGALGIKAGKDLFPVEGEPISMGMNTDQASLKKMVDRREEIFQDEALVASGSSRNVNLTIGSLIEVGDEYTKDSYGTFVITTISHHISHGGDYSNSFEAYPKEVETPPLVSIPTPPYCEAQLAEVTEVNDDKYLGRVKVKFLWQDGKAEESPFIRVATPYTGRDKGFFITPEVGDKVIVAFENNSPDHPYVLTGMYHAETEPEWYAKDNQFKGFKSKGGNQLKFDDKDKHTLLSAPNSMKLHAGKSITMATDGDDDSEIILDTGEGVIKLLAKDVIIVASGSVAIAADQDITASATANLMLEATQNAKVEGMDVSIKADTSASLEGSATAEVKSSGALTIKGSLVKIN